MTMTENDTFLPIAAHKSVVRVDDADNGILQVRVALNQVGHEVAAH